MSEKKSVRKSDKSKAGSKHNMLDLHYRSIGNGTAVLDDPWTPEQLAKFDRLHTLFTELPEYEKKPQRYKPIYHRMKQNLIDGIEGNPRNIKLTDIPASIRAEVGELVN